MASYLDPFRTQSHDGFLAPLSNLTQECSGDYVSPLAISHPRTGPLSVHIRRHFSHGWQRTSGRAG